MSNVIGASITDDAVQIYDRQIRLWGVEAQKRLMDSNVCVIGLSAMNCEITKNLVLAGANFILVDDTMVSEDCLLGNPLLQTADVGTGVSIAEVASHRLTEMNPLCCVKVLKEDSAPLVSASMAEDDLTGITFLLVAVEKMPDVSKLVAWDKAARKAHVGFCLTIACGPFAHFIIDLHEHVVEDLGLEGDSVAKDIPVVPHASAHPGSAVPVTVSYPLLEEALQCSTKLNPQREDFTILAFAGALAFQQKRTMQSASAGEFVRFMEDRAQQRGMTLAMFGSARPLTPVEVWTEPDRDDAARGRLMLEELHAQWSRPMACAVTALGGVCSQEMRKGITLQQVPLANCFAFNSYKSTVTYTRLGAVQT